MTTPNNERRLPSTPPSQILSVDEARKRGLHVPDGAVAVAVYGGELSEPDPKLHFMLMPAELAKEVTPGMVARKVADVIISVTKRNFTQALWDVDKVKLMIVDLQAKHRANHPSVAEPKL